MIGITVFDGAGSYDTVPSEKGALTARSFLFNIQYYFIQYTVS